MRSETSVSQFFSWVFLGTTLLAQAAAPGGETIYAIAKDFGVPAAIVLFVLVEGNKREKRFESRIASNEKFSRTQLVELFKMANAEIRKNTAVLNRLATVLAKHGVTIEIEDAATIEIPLPPGGE